MQITTNALYQVQPTGENIMKCLTVSEMTDGIFHPSPCYINLRWDVIEPTVRANQTLLDASDQTVEFRNMVDSLIWADPRLLCGVYDYLVKNAIQYGEVGGRIVFGAMERGRVHELNVWNNGIGISPERLDMVMDQFVTGMRQVVGKEAGAELYLVQQIIDAHKGQFWMESQYLAWLNVQFTLPLRQWGIRPA